MQQLYLSDARVYYLSSSTSTSVTNANITANIDYGDIFNTVLFLYYHPIKELTLYLGVKGIFSQESLFRTTYSADIPGYRLIGIKEGTFSSSSMILFLVPNIEFMLIKNFTINPGFNLPLSGKNENSGTFFFVNFKYMFSINWTVVEKFFSE